MRTVRNFAFVVMCGAFALFQQATLPAVADCGNFGSDVGPECTYEGSGSYAECDAVRESCSDYCLTFYLGMDSSSTHCYVFPPPSGTIELDCVCGDAN